MAQLQGKVCLITGGSSGIGKEAAIGIAQTGATVVIVGRNRERTVAAVDEIRNLSGNSRVDMFLADLSSQAEIRRLATEFKARYDQLHILVNNAGAIYMQRQLSAEGFEMTWALNHLAYFLLTHLLLDRLTASAPARIINVASDAHQGHKLDFENLQGEKHYSGLPAYGRSKLANILFTYHLAPKLAGSGITVNCLHPGVIGSGFGANNTLFGLLVKLARPFLLTPEQGAANTIYLATSPEVEGLSGQYFVKTRAAKSAPASHDRQAGERLWEISEKLTQVPSFMVP